MILLVFFKKSEKIHYLFFKHLNIYQNILIIKLLTKLLKFFNIYQKNINKIIKN